MKKRHRLNLISGLAFLTVLFGGVVGAGTPAAAAETAWNTQTIWMWFPPKSDYRSCVTKEIDLVRGTYRWQLGNSLEGGWPVTNARGRKIRLEGGTYRWEDCVFYYFSTGTGLSFYAHKSVLTRPGFLPATVGYTWDWRDDGWHYVTWGSYLNLRCQGDEIC